METGCAAQRGIAVSGEAEFSLARVHREAGVRCFIGAPLDEIPECGGVDHDADPFAARSRSTYLRTFPEAFVGSSETISTLRGTL